MEREASLLGDAGGWAVSIEMDVGRAGWDRLHAQAHTHVRRLHAQPLTKSGQCPLRECERRAETGAASRGQTKVCVFYGRRECGDGGGGGIEDQGEVVLGAWVGVHLGEDKGGQCKDWRGEGRGHEDHLSWWSTS